MRRGDVVTAAARGAYSGKPRPAVVVQADRFEAGASVTICIFTTEFVDAPLFRIPVVATAANGLHRDSWLMADKLMTVPRERAGDVVGRLADEDLLRLNRAIAVFLGLAG